MGPLVIPANPGVHIHPGYCTVPYWGYDPNAYSKNRNRELSYVEMIHYSCPVSRFDQYPYSMSKHEFYLNQDIVLISLVTIFQVLTPFVS